MTLSNKDDRLSPVRTEEVVLRTETGETPFPDAPERPSASSIARAKAEADLVALRAEVERLRDRLSTIKARGKTAVRAQMRSMDASAHEQLGDYPWLKVAGASAATFVAARLLRTMPLGVVFAALATQMRPPRR